MGSYARLLLRPPSEEHCPEGRWRWRRLLLRRRRTRNCPALTSQMPTSSPSPQRAPPGLRSLSQPARPAAARCRVAAARAMRRCALRCNQLGSRPACLKAARRLRLHASGGPALAARGPQACQPPEAQRQPPQAQRQPPEAQRQPPEAQRRRGRAGARRGCCACWWPRRSCRTRRRPAPCRAPPPRPALATARASR